MEKSCSTCQHRTYDMDGLYCEHPISLANSSGFGLSLEAMDRTLLCFHGSSEEPARHELWEQKLTQTEAEKTTASIASMMSK